MDGYIVQKKSRILEVTYLPGETIPKDAVPPDLEGRLVDLGYIVPIGEGPPQIPASGAQEGAETIADPPKVKVPITTKDGVLTLEMAQEDIAEVIRILQLNAEKATAAVKTIKTEEILILIDTLDDRKTVKNAVRAKAEAAEKDGDGKNAKGEIIGDA